MTASQPEDVGRRGPWYRYWTRLDRGTGSADEQLVPASLHVEPEVSPAAFHVEPPQVEPGPFHVEHRRGRRAPVLVVANQKGGVGKTTTAVSLAAALAEQRQQVLLVDLDPQGNASSGVGIRVGEDVPSVYDVLIGDTPVRDVIRPTGVDGLALLPATLDLAGAEIELVTAFSREQKLRRALEPVRDLFDVILVDCPPSLGLLTVNALSAGDGVIVPIQCEYFALEGLGALQRNADLVRSQLNPGLQILGFVLTMLDARTRLSQQVVDDVLRHYGDLVFRSRIPRSIRLAEAPGFGQPITRFDPASRGAMAYRRLATEVLDRLPRLDRATSAAASAAGGVR